MDAEGHLREDGDKPHLVVVVVGLGVAGNVAGDDFGSCRSSGELGVVATTSKAEWGWHLRALRCAVSKVDMSAGPLRGRRHVGGEHMWRWVRVSSLWLLQRARKRM